MKAPPLLPEETFHRVLRVASRDGLGLMAIAGMLALASASMRDVSGTAVGLLVAAAGAIELHGAGLLRAGEVRGMRWVMVSQPYLLTVLLIYCAWRLAVPELPEIPPEMRPVMEESARQFGNTVEEHVRMFYGLTYQLLAVGTLLYQGGMTIYYARRQKAVTAAVEAGGWRAHEPERE